MYSVTANSLMRQHRACNNTQLFYMYNIRRWLGERLPLPHFTVPAV